MEKEKTNSRLESLDGLRGFAIILVFLNHINTTYIASLLPSQLFGWFFANGVTGVTFLFILSGFLMSYLYPQPAKPLQFLQKRYTRIFPLFLTMCAVMMAYRIAPTAPWYLFAGYILILSLLVHSVWVYGIKKLPRRIGTSLFFLFLSTQIFIGAFYALWIMRQPPIIFSQLPFLLHETLIGLVNGTLTLSLGDYIPMIDGVYWTLAAEVLFYILHPLLFAPIVLFISGQNRVIKILFILLLLPFFGGIHMLSQHIAGLSMLQLELFYYFVTGVTLGTIFKSNPAIIYKFSSVFSKNLYYVPLLLFFIVMASVHNVGLLVSKEMGPWVRLLYAIPLTLIVSMLLDNDNILAKIGRGKVLVFIGTISYSIYLSHALTIHMFESLIIPTNLIVNVLYVSGAFLACIIISFFLFYTLEKPYFKKRVHTNETPKNVNQTLRINPRLLIGTSLAVYLIAVFSAYSSHLNFFSSASKIPSTNIISPKIPTRTILLSPSQPLIFTVTPDQDKFGIVTVFMSPVKTSTAPELQTIQFRIKEDSSFTWYSSSQYSMNLFDKEQYFPFGFPQIAESRGKKYLVELSFMNQSSLDSITIDTDQVSAVYPVSKKHLIQNPSQLGLFMYDKFRTVGNSAEARTAFIPILLIAPFAFLKKRRI